MDACGGKRDRVQNDSYTDSLPSHEIAIVLILLRLRLYFTGDSIRAAAAAPPAGFQPDFAENLTIFG